MFRTWKILLILIILGGLHPNVSFSQDADTVMAGQRGVTYSVVPTNGSTYQWFAFGGKIVSGNGSNQVLVNWGEQLGTHKIGVVETNKYGCSGDTVWHIVFVSRNIFPTIYGKTLVCEGERVTLTASSEDSVYKDIFYKWSTGDISKEIEVNVFKKSTYYCVLYYNGDAVDTAFITIDVLPNKIQNFSWSPLFPKQGDAINFRFDNPNNDKFFWVVNGSIVDTNSNENFSYVFDSLGFNKVDLIVVNAIGCESVKSYRINIEGESLFQIPNAFTPNDDGINDELYVKLPEGLRDCKTIIFNRWGMKVYESNSLDEIRWDGYFQGQKIERGAYIIDITANTNENRYMHQSATISIIN